MNRKTILPLLLVLALGGLGAWLLLQSGHDHAGSDHGHAHGHGGHHDDPAGEAPRGPHSGRLFTAVRAARGFADGGFTLELAIFEDGVPPEFRAWFTLDGRPLPPDSVQLSVTLTRPGNVVDEHIFTSAGEFARSPLEVYEPHSFHYDIRARRGDRSHRWELDAPEMQTTIDADTAQRAGIVVEPAGPAVLAETITVYGQVKLNADRLARATPRFAGLVREARKSLGDPVAAGEVVAVIEANDSLAVFAVTAPRAGVVIGRTAAAGETVAGGAPLYTIADFSEVWIDLNIPRGEQARVRPGQPVTLHTEAGPDAAGVIAWLSPLGSAETQTLTARIVRPNLDGRWRPGLFVKADITTATTEVPVAVKESALQTLFDFDVVFSQHGELYQARPLELGRRSGGLVEVRKGLRAGELYVTANSFLIKADIGKSGAAHDH
jgi:membrane fusion protein, heavy metal efflux system